MKFQGVILLILFSLNTQAQNTREATIIEVGNACTTSSSDDISAQNSDVIIYRSIAKFKIAKCQRLNGLNSIVIQNEEIVRFHNVDVSKNESLVISRRAGITQAQMLPDMLKNQTEQTLRACEQKRLEAANLVRTLDATACADLK
jgi:hypothetical protein